MIYGLLIAFALLGVTFLIQRNYTSKRKQSHSRIHWHRLIANNVYLAVVKLPGKPSWEIEISVFPEENNRITISSDDKKKHVDVEIHKGTNLLDLSTQASSSNDMDAIVKLFLEGMSRPNKAAPLFPKPKDYEIYKEFVFYLKTALEKRT